jgi:hypothetical protein
MVIKETVLVGQSYRDLRRYSGSAGEGGKEVVFVAITFFVLNISGDR